jgi:hypothetical protein
MGAKTKAPATPKRVRGASKKPVRRKLLTRRNLRKPGDTNETHEDIQRALTNSKGSLDLKGKLNLSRDSIVVAEKVFQWRLLDTDVANREDHILGMANAIADSGKPLDAILVLPVGDRFYAVDGHHRLAAYDTARWSRMIPATVFCGTLIEARREALRLNSKNKLPMTKDDKQEAAWRFVKLEDGSTKEQISEWSTASTSNIGIMKSKLRKLKKLEGVPIADLTWAQALRMNWEPDAGGKEWDADEWKERKAQEIVDALLNSNIAFMLRKDPEITAIALERLDGNLAGGLMYEWFLRPENEDRITGFIEDHLDERTGMAWTAAKEPMKF